MQAQLRRSRVASAHAARIALLAWACAAASACRAAAPSDAPARSELEPIRATLAALYASFGFDAGGEADWRALRELTVDGSVWVDPIAPGGAARAVETEEFVRSFREAIRTSPELSAGLHERILHARIDAFGNVAHAWVAFEGWVPGETEARTRGLDSVQLVCDHGSWRIASFTTQYEMNGLSLPPRFLAPRECD